jgi:hypothetical protein
VGVVTPITAEPATATPAVVPREPISATELVTLVKEAKGVLKVSASGHLQLTGGRIPDELFEALRAQQEEVTAFLVSRKKAMVAVELPTASSEGFVETRRAYIPCANCGHWRTMHCTKRKLKPGEVPTHAKWKGFVDDDGQIQPCSHTLPDANPYACDSNACAVVIDSEHYCPCKKWVSPLAKKRAANPSKALPDGVNFRSLIPREALQRAHDCYLQQQAAQKVDKAKVLLEVVREDPSLTVQQLAEASGMSASWVRKHLRQAVLLAPAKSRKNTAFTTGQEPLPGVEAPPLDVNP